MRTTLDLPDLLFRRAKLAAVQRRVTLKELMTRALEREIEENPGPARRMSAPPVKKTGEHMIPALTNAEVAALFDEQDIRKAE